MINFFPFHKVTPFSFFVVLADNVCLCIHVGLGHGVVFKEVWSLVSPVTLHFPPGRNIFVYTGLVVFKYALFVLKMEFWEPPVFNLKRIAVKAYILSRYPLLKCFVFFCVGVAGVVMFSPLLRALSLVIHFCLRKCSEDVWPCGRPLPSRSGD